MIFRDSRDRSRRPLVVITIKTLLDIWMAKIWKIWEEYWIVGVQI